MPLRRGPVAQSGSDRVRVLHTMIRVGDRIEPRAAGQGCPGCGFGDLDRSIGFYTDVLGMKLLRRTDYPDGKFTLALVGLGR